MRDDVIEIDGSQGEGGGQMLRTSLAMGAITGKAFEMVNVRAKRKVPGLKRQHLTCLKAAAEVCGAQVDGAEVSSLHVVFKPGRIKAGKYRFDIGTAGSVTLVAQTVLPILLCADGASEVTITGGTHVPMSPCWEYFANTYLPQLRKMGAEVEARLVRYGFYPAGGGEIVLKIKPWIEAKVYDGIELGNGLGARVIAKVANLHQDIAASEVKTVASQLPTLMVRTESEVVASAGPGNYCALELSYDNVVMVCSDIGTYNRSRKAVANSVVSSAKSYLESGGVADEYLSDQLLLPIVMAGDRLPDSKVWGRFTMPRHRSLHFDTNWSVLRQFRDDIEMTVSEVVGCERQFKIKTTIGKMEV